MSSVSVGAGHRDRARRANQSPVAFDPRIAVIRDPDLETVEVWVQRVVRRHPSEEDVDQAVAAGPAGVCSLIRRTASEVIRNHRLVAVRGRARRRNQKVCPFGFRLGVAQRQG